MIPTPIPRSPAGTAFARPTASRALAACPVCGCGALHTDEVYDRSGVLVLTECPRCEHRVLERLTSLPRAPLRAGWRGAEARSDSA
ncbi:MAG TPA: hypothetical protein VHQ66_13865 [Myxococcota bacterium]|jgi:hypothetical protein|nr:hypothetical protein [Myxococcota bacterium]